MAFTPVPSTWLGAGYTVDTSPHVVKFTTSSASSNKILKQLTDAQADPTTGDIREIFLAMCEAFHQANVSQAANPPAQMTVKRAIADNAGVTTATYTFAFKIDPSAFGVIAEP
jgi:hypothetical protein